MAEGRAPRKESFPKNVFEPGDKRKIPQGIMLSYLFDFHI